MTLSQSIYKSWSTTHMKMKRELQCQYWLYMLKWQCSLKWPNWIPRIVHLVRLSGAHWNGNLHTVRSQSQAVSLLSGWAQTELNSPFLCLNWTDEEHGVRCDVGLCIDSGVWTRLCVEYVVKMQGEIFVSSPKNRASFWGSGQRFLAGRSFRGLLQDRGRSGFRRGRIVCHKF